MMNASTTITRTSPMESKEGAIHDNNVKEATLRSVSKNHKHSAPAPWTRISDVIRVFVLELPLVIFFGLWLCAILLQRVYGTYVIPIVESYKRQPMRGDFYEEFANDFTYYNRHCGPDDITTRSANDLLIQEHYSEREAADVMLEHGAVAFQNVLSNETATELRAYLATKHEYKEVLPYNEVFWHEINRLSLGLGTSDHPAIAQALKEIGTHPVIKRTLEGILGPDPAILEISTLTSLNGAEDQGIHTDSDWFGSSLLYSRNFLHSYSLFVALQDTSKDLGATTVCPGTHFCADQDLEDLCLNHGAFEVSTNGQTGPDGLLRKGDAFLFNQNIWHRGPRNVDPDGLDRIMFIMTFATARDDPADRRRQGLGTYYYQRFNMWGSTYSMLKDATTTLVQPIAGMRALGLLRTRGVTWIHQFAQQFANGEMFYNDDTLEEFFTKILGKYNVPMFLRPTSDRWETFIPELIAIWVEFITALTIAAGIFYCIGTAVAMLVDPGGKQIKYSFTRLAFLMASTAAIFATLSAYTDRTDLAKSVTTKDVFVKPFPAPPVTHTVANRGITFPERTDVLISTRFDAKFLASFNRFLSFHPGNKRWEKNVSDAALLPDNLVRAAAKDIVKNTLLTQEAGIHARFLLQDPATGAWTEMSEEDALKETIQAIQSIRKPLIGILSKELKYLLADARFGKHRETAMARMSVTTLMDQWPRLLFGEDFASNTSIVTKPKPSRPFEIRHKFSIRTNATQGSARGISRRSSLPLRKEVSKSDKSSGVSRVGDKVWVYSESYWYEAKIIDIYDDGEGCVVYYYNTGSVEEKDVDDVRPYYIFHVGDRVEVDYYGNSKAFYPGTITGIHPDGTCSVQFDDGTLARNIGREDMLLADETSLPSDEEDLDDED